MKRFIDVFATLVLLFVVTVQTIMLFDKVRLTYQDNVLTYDLNLPTWPLFLVAWAGRRVRGDPDRLPRLAAGIPSRAAQREACRRKAQQ